jgi:hypothetical protein
MFIRRLAALVALGSSFVASTAGAQTPACACGHPHQHYGATTRVARPFAPGPSQRNAFTPIRPTDPYGRPALPRGRNYYGGRFFGSFDNRLYGPQYGYF